MENKAMTNEEAFLESLEELKEALTDIEYHKNSLNKNIPEIFDEDLGYIDNSLNIITRIRDEMLYAEN